MLLCLWMKQHKGFTIIELLVVIVIVAILASITLVVYNGVKSRAQMAKIDSDLRMIKVAIEAARGTTGLSMTKVTTREHTGADCLAASTGTDIINLPKTHPCWANYIVAMDNLSIQSGMNVRNLLDPWGRPYFLYEKEDTYTYLTLEPCGKDEYGVLEYPHRQWAKLKLLYLERLNTPPVC